MTHRTALTLVAITTLIGATLLAAGCGVCRRAAGQQAREAREAAARPAPEPVAAVAVQEPETTVTPTAAAIEADPSGRIVAVHAEVPADRVTTQLPGALAVPGLHDAHLHLLGVGRVKERVELRGASSIAALRQTVADFLVAHPDVPFVVGRGWDQSLLAEGRMPTSADLAGLTDKPMMLRRVDGHAAVVNPTLLASLALTAETADPSGGRILRDESGQPTGVLVDRAMEQAWTHAPEPTTADLKRWARAGAAACAEAGLVAVHDMGMSVEALAALEAVDAESALPIRVFVYLDGDAEASYAWLEAHQAAARQRSERIVVQGIKLYADGAMGSRGAVLLTPYSDEPGHSGTFVTSPEQLAERVARVHAAGAQVAIHAIGDHGNRAALDAIAAAQGPAAEARRHRIEHAQLVHADDFPRFAALGVVASMQPTHATSDMRWARDRVGEGRLAGAYAWRRMLEQGVVLAFGSDAPVESERPLLGLHAATTRTDGAGEPVGGWLPGERVDDIEALTAFSATAAWVVGREADLGRLVVGHRFDVTLFEQDPRGRTGAWLKAGIAGTVIDGRATR